MERHGGSYAGVVGAELWLEQERISQTSAGHLQLSARAPHLGDAMHVKGLQRQYSALGTIVVLPLENLE